MALDIQDAINPSGVAHAFLDICLILRSQSDFEGTAALKRDPALRLIAYKLADMMGNHVTPPVVYTNAYEACKRMAATAKDMKAINETEARKLGDHYGSSEGEGEL